MGILTKRDKTELDRPPLARPKRSRVGEITTGWAREFKDGIRTFRKTFWPSTPTYVSTTLSYVAARSLYRNDSKDSNLGSGFCKRIVNAVVDFTDLPQCVTGDEIVDEFVNNTIHTYWSAELRQAIRDCSRDGDTVVRLRRHNPTNKLISVDEWEACYLEVVNPESCAIYYKGGGTKGEIDVAYIRHEIDEVQEQAEQSGRVLRQPITRQHVLIEEITPESFRYFDETAGEWRDDMQETNAWGFVPLVEMHNEYDESLKGGQSEFEGPLPFIQAFHDVLGQTLVAHKAHSIPKAKFRVHDMMNFIASNWPESFDRDENGMPVLDSFKGDISWKGTEMLFMDSEEDVDFLQVQSALGDSKTLLDFLLTCIVISSETPRSVLMDQSVQDTDEMIPLAKKIARKQVYFNPPIQDLVKMLLAINFMDPIRVPFDWGEITPAIALLKAQALQQDVMSLEVLASREVISDRTIRATVRPQIPRMKSPTQEAADAKKNVPLPGSTPTPPNDGSGGATSKGSVTGSDAGNKTKAGTPN